MKKKKKDNENKYLEKIRKELKLSSKDELVTFESLKLSVETSPFIDEEKKKFLITWLKKF